MHLWTQSSSWKNKTLNMTTRTQNLLTNATTVLGLTLITLGSAFIVQEKLAAQSPVKPDSNFSGFVRGDETWKIKDAAKTDDKSLIFSSFVDPTLTISAVTVPTTLAVSGDDYNLVIRGVSNGTFTRLKASDLRIESDREPAVAKENGKWIITLKPLKP